MTKNQKQEHSEKSLRLIDASKCVAVEPENMVRNPGNTKNIYITDNSKIEFGSNRQQLKSFFVRLIASISH